MAGHTPVNVEDTCSSIRMPVIGLFLDPKRQWKSQRTLRAGHFNAVYFRRGLTCTFWLAQGSR